MRDLSDWYVLLVDDEEDAQAVLVPILEHNRISVDTAFTAEEALDKLKDHSPTLAVVDLGLPGMNGWDMLATMQGDPYLSRIPVVAITAFHSITVAEEALKAGFAAYFPKPINSRTFVQDLEQTLEDASM
jgi:CheY-like chemotaxis protein